MISDNECLVLPSAVVAAAVQDHDREERQVKVRLEVDIACRAAHRAACADETGKIMWSGHRLLANRLQQGLAIPFGPDVRLTATPLR